LFLQCPSTPSSACAHGGGDEIHYQLLKREEQLTLFEGDLAAKAESLSVRETVVEAAEKEVVSDRTTVGAEHAQVATNA
jgi:hypothetical protein